MKILIVHASAGAGHRKAAEAIYKDLCENSPHEVTLVDSLDYTNRVFKFCYSTGYSFVIKNFPWLWGLFFYFFEIKFLWWLFKFLRRLSHAMNSPRLVRFILKENPDVILSTHFMVNEIVSHLKDKHISGVKIVSVVTDYNAHLSWVADYVDIYCVAIPEVKKELIYKGVDENKIIVTGIPVDTNFTKVTDRDEIRQRLDFKDGSFSILIVAGAIGIGPIYNIAQLLKDKFQLVILCGKNEKLRKDLLDLKSDNIKAFGMVDNMHEFMAACDIIITKAGGLTTTESLVSNIPIIYFNIIPGQEGKNAKLFESHGIAKVIKDISGIDNFVTELREDNNRYDSIREKMKQIAKPNAVRDIINIIEGCNEKPGR